MNGKRVVVLVFYIWIIRFPNIVCWHDFFSYIYFLAVLSRIRWHRQTGLFLGCQFYSIGLCSFYANPILSSFYYFGFVSVFDIRYSEASPPPSLFFCLGLAFAIWYHLCFHKTFRVFFFSSSFVKVIGTFTGSALCSSILTLFHFNNINSFIQWCFPILLFFSLFLQCFIIFIS